MSIWVYTSEANGKRIRERYLQAILRQEIAYFDDVGAGEVATRIQTDTRKSYSIFQRSNSPYLRLDLVQMGISEKVTVSVTCISSFVVGFILAYARSWRLALALSSMIVCIIAIGGVMKKFLSKYTQ
jgi:ATP-binding cassette subfamily B (MDR/TAP) protein 1